MYTVQQRLYLLLTILLQRKIDLHIICIEMKRDSMLRKKLLKW